MSDYDRTIELVDTAYDSAGKSTEQFAKYQDTLEYKINQLQTTWEEFRTQFFNSEFFKGIIDGLTELLNKLNDLSTGEIVSLGATFLTLGPTIAEGLSESAKHLGSNFANLFPSINGSFANSIDQLQSQFNQGIITEAQFNQQAEELRNRGAILGNGLATGITTGLTTALTTENPGLAIVGTIAPVLLSALPSFISAFRAAMSVAGTTGGAALKAGVTAVGGWVTLIIAGIAAVITGIIAAVKWAVKTAEEASFENRFADAKKAAEEAEEAAQRAAASAKEAKQSFNDLTETRERFEELNKKGYLNTEEQEEYNSLVEQIKETYPEVITYYDEANNKLYTQAAAWDTIIAKQEETLKLANQQALATNIESSLATGQVEKMTLYSSFADKLESKYGEKFGDTYVADALLPDSGSIENWVASGFNENTTVGRMLETLEITEEEIEGFKKAYEDTASQMLDEVAKGFAETWKNNEDAGEGEAAAVEAIFRANLENTGFDENTDWNDYIQANAGNNSFMDVLGGARGTTGADSNELNKWDNVVGSRELAKDDPLRAWGIKTASDIKKYFRQAYETEEEAEEAWNSLKTDQEGRNKIFQTVISQAMVEFGEEAAATVEAWSPEVVAAINKGFTKLSVDGTTQSEIDEFIDLLVANGLTPEQATAATAIYQAEVDKTVETTKQNQLDTNGKEVNTLQTQRHDTLIVNAGDLGQMSHDTARDYINKQMATIEDMLNITDTNKQLTIMESLDWESISLTNLDEERQRYAEAWAETYHTSTEEGLAAFDAMMENARRNNQIVLSISSEGELEEFFDALEDDLTTYVEGINGVMDTLEEQLTQGYVDFSDAMSFKEEMEELGFDGDEYIQYGVDEEGLTRAVINYEKFKQDALNNEELQKEAILKLAKAENEARIAEIDAELSILNALSTEESSTIRLIRQNAELLEITQLRAEAVAKMTGQTVTFEKYDVDKVVATFSQDEDEDGKPDIDELIAQLETEKEELQNTLDSGLIEGSGEYERYKQKILAGTTEIIDGLDGIETSSTEAANATSDAADKISDAAEQIAEAEKAAYEAYHGTDLYNPSLDGWYNYEAVLKSITDDLEEINDLLESAETKEEKIALLNQQTAKQHEASVVRQARLQTLQINQSENSKWLEENASQYVSQLPDGTYIVNKSLFENPDVPDAWAEEVIRRTEWQNEAKSQEKEILKEERDFQKQRKEQQEKYLNDYVSFTEKGAKYMEDAAKEEVETLQNKYEAMTEADNDYLDALEAAIEKQRELRDRENSFEDLAQKRRKLALLQRDTSGANQKEALSLQNEIQEDEQNLLDEQVDSLIDGMRELSEEQEETRNAEIELKNAIIEETNYMKLFEETFSHFNSEEDVIEWLMDQVNINEYTVAEIEKMQNEFSAAYNSSLNYVALTSEQTIEFTEATADEIQMTMEILGNNALLSVENTTAQVEQEIWDAQQEAEKALAEALKNYQDTINGMVEASAEGYKNISISANNAINVASAKAVGVEDDTGNIVNTIAAEEYSKASGGKYGYGKGVSVEAVTDLSSLEKSYAALKQQEEEQKSAQNTSYTLTHHESLLQRAEESSNTVGALGTVREKIKGGRLHYTNSELSKNDSAPYRYMTEGYAAATGEDRLFVYGASENTIRNWLNSHTIYNAQGVPNEYKIKKNSNFDHTVFYKHGGLVDYTGPAWVDGTPSKPEAFLNADDTKRIGEAAKLLSNLPILNSTSNAANAVSTNVGDTSIEIHINVENIGSDYDVEQMIDRVKQEIVDVSNPIGGNIIVKR